MPAAAVVSARVGESHAREFEQLTLLVPALERWRTGAVARAWRRHGGRVRPVDRYWDAPLQPGPGLRLRGPDAFCRMLAARLGRVLPEPHDEWLARLPAHLLHRRVQVSTLGALAQHPRRRFIKPVEPKLFRAQVTDDPGLILARYSATRHDTRVLVSDVVVFDAEVRVFVLDDQVATAATYRGCAAPGDALDVARQLLPFPAMPRAWVVDVGRLAGGAWAVIEFNAVHAAADYGCDPRAVARCVAAIMPTLPEE